MSPETDILRSSVANPSTRAGSSLPTSRSYRTILKTTALKGGSTLATTLVAIVRVKLVAVMLGSAGMGLLGLLSGIQSTAAALAGMGLVYSGVREVAAFRNDAVEQRNVRYALRILSAFFGTLAVLALWTARSQVAQLTFGDTKFEGEVGLLGFGVFLTVIYGYQAAILQGMRQIRELAAIEVVAAILSTGVGIGAIVYYRERGILVLLICGPLVSAGLASFFIKGLGRSCLNARCWRKLLPHSQSLLKLGVSCMAVAVMSGLAGIAARSLLTTRLGLGAAGQFGAAWAISTQYVGFLTAAMAADYYPRLTQLIGNRRRAVDLVTQQLEVTLLLGAPALVCMFSIAPWLTELLYSSNFSDAVPIIRWQLLGCIVKLASWPLVYLLLAQGRARVFFFVELGWTLSYIATISVGLSTFGLNIAGVAFFTSYVLYFCAVCLLARASIAYRFPLSNVVVCTGAFAIAAVVYGLAKGSQALAEIVGLTLSACFGAGALLRLMSRLAPDGRFSHLYSALYTWRSKVPFGL